MKRRFSQWTRLACMGSAALLVGIVAHSCKDEYTLDDEKPSWLNSSIYQCLADEGVYTNYLALLADPDVNSDEDADNNRSLVDILSKTGSKTVFVANDEAWEAWYKSNAELPETDPWHTATSYDNLSTAQKKLLIHTSMLNNAIVMENLASSEGTDIVRGEYMRRYTDVESTDSITYLAGSDLPVNYSEGNGETDYWARFREENGGNGVYVVTDSSVSMMLHFTSEFLTKNNITDNDFAIFMGQERVTSDVHIYDSKLVDKDGVCENGYVNVTDQPLRPLPNMAELLKTNGKTRIFSHMLDRWSAPFYNAGVTQAYKNVMAAKGIEWTDSIFSKRYFSDNSWGHTSLTTDPDGNTFRDASSTDVGLKFDPGWNAYYDEKSGPQYDMAAMYVPVDEVLWEYFQTGGGGWQLIQTYCDPSVTYSASHTDDDYEALFRNIDQIPISTLRSLINVIMFRSFISSVPSKMTKLRDDAQEQIFYSEDLDHVVGSILASNGVIYLTDKVYGPADYTSVAAPAYISKDNLVMRYAIYNGSTDATDYMKWNYYAYLKAMKSTFVLFLPSDAALKYYYDPVSFVTKPRVVEFSFNESASNAKFPINYALNAYDETTGEIGDAYSLESMSNSEIINRLKDILESHTIVIEDGSEEIDSAEDEFYITKNGNAVRVIREGGKIVGVQGGFQMENETAGLWNVNPGVTLNNVTDEHNLSNGTTYVLDSPIIPSARSVYKVLTDDEDTYGEFYNLFAVDEEIIKACGLVDVQNLTKSKQTSEMKKYYFFVDDNGPDYNVQFYNNYRYTVLAPTNAAVEAAIAAGLPSWESITEDYEECEKDEDNVLVNGEDSLRLQTKIVYLTNFLRNHFLDNSVFVDKSTIEATEYVSASYNSEKGLFCKINVRRSGGVLEFKDDNDGEWLTASGKVNVMARDVSCSSSPKTASTMNGITIDATSFSVIHQIPGVMNHTELVGGRYDSTWSTAAKCKNYLSKFAIR